MRRGAGFFFSLTLLFFVSYFLPAVAQEPASCPKRIVSLAPNITEILFALGLGDKVVGVTRYCDFPAQAKKITQVGGLVDANYEQIVTLQPDLAILLDSNDEGKRELEKLKIQVLAIPHETIQDIHEGIRSIGRACGAEVRAHEILSDLTQRTEAITRAVKGVSCPSVLICIGRDLEGGQLSRMVVAGRNGLYDEIIELAGGVNVYRVEKVAYPQVSPEGVIHLNPDIIVDLVSKIKPGETTQEEIVQQWNRLRPVKAVRERRVYVIEGDHALRPGPRYIQFLEELARLFHRRQFEGEGGP